MGEDLLKAKMAIAIADGKFNNLDKVLAEIIMMSKTKKSFTSKDLSETIMKNMGISLENYRKLISELKKLNLIKKENQLFKLNTNFITL